jgi:hypothetical protein
MLEISNFKQHKAINDNIIFAKNNDDDFWRILRKQVNYRNCNSDEFGHVTQDVSWSKDGIKKSIELLRSDEAYRLSLKSGPGTLITDAPGFGSMRLNPPYEPELFDKDYFEFINSMIDDNDSVAELGGAGGHFLALVGNKNNPKTLVEKSDVGNIEDENITYVDFDNLNTETDRFDCLFSYHTIEHLSEPEQMIDFMVNNCNKFSIFATPLEELIETSIQHYIFVSEQEIRNQLSKYKKHCFVHVTQNARLDIHVMTINSTTIFQKASKNSFFNKYWTYYTNDWIRT